MNIKRKCFRCGVTSGDPDVVLYRFPKPGIRNIYRCELWAKFLFPHGQWSCRDFQNKLYSEHRMLCCKHFKPSAFINFAQKKLHRHAAPTEGGIVDAAQSENFVVPGPSSPHLMDITNTRTSKSDELKTKQINLITTTTPGSSHTPLNKISDKISQSLEESQYPVKINLITTTTPGSSHTPLNKISDKISQSLEESQYPVKINTMTPGPSHAPLNKISNKITQSLEERQYLVKNTKTLLSRKSRHYYLKSRKYLKVICQLRNSVKKLKAKHVLSMLAEDEIVKQLENKVSPTFALLLQAQIKNFKKKPQGRRWTEEDKVIALRLYKRSPTCYRLLRRLFCLPSPSLIKKLLSLFNMPPGINLKVLKTLKNIMKTQKPSNNEFIIMFDEMSIKKHLLYNKKNDLIEGFQDHGNHGRSTQETVKALVFMIAGIRIAYKQPLAYYLSGANVTADRLTVLIKEVLRECFNVGLQVSTTVCDMGGMNRRALSTLGATQDRPIIKIDNKEVIALYDTPHLLKCFRNNFIKYDIKCKADISSSFKCGEGLAKWSDIQKFYEMDSLNPHFVYAPLLTKNHIDPNTKQKMKVNLAAQVISHSVAAGIYSKVSEGKLPARAAITADVITKMDQLFDLMNSNSPDRRRGKLHATNMSERSPHLIFFQRMKKFLKEIQFVGSARPPPSLEGWIWTINGIEMLWAKIKLYPDVKSLATRRLQQDPLENLFGCIRGNCGSNINPTTAAFIGGLKTAIISNLAHISSGNCQDDNNLAIVSNFKNLLSPPTQKCTEDNDCLLVSSFHETIDSKTIEDSIGDTAELQACAYVCGFLIKNHKLLYNCLECKRNFETDELNHLHNFVENKEYNDVKKCLNYASRGLVVCVEKCALIINSLLTKDASKNNLKKFIENNINDEVFDIFKSCPDHFKQNKNYIKRSVFHICVNRFCTLKNRKYSDDASRSALKRKIDILKNK